MAKNSATSKMMPVLPTRNGREGNSAALATPLQIPGAQNSTPSTRVLDPNNPPGDDNPFGAVVRASAYAVAQAQLDAVADFMDLDDDLRLYLRTCQRELIVHFPVRMDDGHMR